MSKSPADEIYAGIRDRARGALLGLAVGDALGTTLEFAQRDGHPHHTEINGGGIFRLQPGQWTDDTAMALAFADSLIKCGRFDPKDLMQRFVAWYRHGEYSCTGTCFDIGLTTRLALHRFEQTGNPFAGSTDPRTAGNGSLMRTAPAAIFAAHDEALARQIARDQSRTTHGTTNAIEACEYLTLLMHRAITGETHILRSGRKLASEFPAIRKIIRRDYHRVQRNEISSTGYVASTLQAAIWSLTRTTSFEDALILAVNLAGDADTVGAVTGQLAGSIYGAKAIPKRWLKKLAWRDQITNVADKLLQARPAAPGCGLKTNR